MLATVRATYESKENIMLASALVKCRGRALEVLTRSVGETPGSQAMSI